VISTVIRNPMPQRALRGHRAPRPTPRAAGSAEHQACLAARLTPRDKWILRMVFEHRVLTATQLTALAFPSPRAARQRLRELYQWSVLDRFQPFRTLGTAPMHYVLGPAGAVVLAAEHGLHPADLGYRRDRALAVSHSLRLAHTIGVNDWFSALIAHARHHRAHAVTAWWSETRCARHFGDLVQPDAYGRWATGSGEIEFFLEFDFGTETLTRLTNKIPGYAALATSTAISTPLLIWFTSPRRETHARRELTHALTGLDQPGLVPIATATPAHLDPHATHPSPADPVWLPLTTTSPTGRVGLHQLTSTWAHLPAPTTSSPAHPATAPTPTLPPPEPMPPAPSSPRRPRHDDG
jgi:hypothetical protein